MIVFGDVTALDKRIHVAPYSETLLSQRDFNGRSISIN